jgi:putative tryptophan/tyrosine transport system substrate-binding protein
VVLRSTVRSRAPRYTGFKMTPMSLRHHPRRRQAVGVLAFLLVAVAGHAQDAATVRRIGFIGMDSGMQAARLEAFREGMRQQGYREGGNLVIEVRWADGRFDRLPALANELVARKVEVIVTAAPPAVRAAKNATTKIPIVMIVHDPVGMLLAESLAHPGGNITGIAFQDAELSTKRVDLLRAVVPNLKRLAIIWNLAGGGDESVKAVQHVAALAGIETRAMEIREPVDIAAAVGDAKAWGAQAVIQLASPFITLNRRLLMEALAQYRMPASCEMGLYVQEGCLMTYSADLSGMFRDLSPFVAAILKGAKAADLPIQQPREFELVVNLRTAETLGLTIPAVVKLQMTNTVR